MSARPKTLGAHLHKQGVMFRVWAPFAERVFVTGSFNDWSRAELESEQGGYWSVDVRHAVAGQEYKFIILNGGKELFRNDPHSLQLTTSSGGTSVIADTAFEWEDDSFTAPPIEQQVLYELHVGTFYRPDPSLTGTFDDVAQKLDYLAGLGVNMIELMPVNSMSSDRGWGYAIDYIYAIESLYGGRRGLLELIKAAHKRGIGVVLDVVYNHFGPDPAGLDLWQFDGWSQNGKGGIYFFNDERAETPWGDTRPDFGRSEVQDYILGSVAMWMTDCHIDGLRVDSTIYIRNLRGNNDDPANDIPEGWRLLQRLTEVAREVNPSVVLIAEDVGQNDYLTMPTSAGGAGFGAQWEMTFPEVLRRSLGALEDTQRDLSAVCGLLTKTFNGDPFQRIIYSDSHDSAANGGARLNEIISPGNPASLFARKRSLLASALVLTSPGRPMLFQGQEFMQGGSFNDWQGLDWESAEHYSGIIKAHQDLIALRKNSFQKTGGLSGPHINILHTDWNNNVLAYHRWGNGGPGDDTVVIMNFNNRVHTEYRINFPYNGIWHVRFNSSWSGYSPDFKDVELETVEVGPEGTVIRLAPYSVLIFSQE